MEELTFGGLHRLLGHLQATGGLYEERFASLLAGQEALENKLRQLESNDLTEKLEGIQRTMVTSLERCHKEQAVTSLRVDGIADRLESSVHSLEAFNQEASAKLVEIESKIENKVGSQLNKLLDERWALTQKAIAASRTAQEERIAALEAQLERLAQRESFERMLAMQESISQGRMDNMERRCAELEQTTSKLGRQVREVGLAFTGRRREAMLGVLLRSASVISSTLFGCWVAYTKAAREVRQKRAALQEEQPAWATDGLPEGEGSIADSLDEAIDKALRWLVAQDHGSFDNLRLELRSAAHLRLVTKGGMHPQPKIRPVDRTTTHHPHGGTIDVNSAEDGTAPLQAADSSAPAMAPAGAMDASDVGPQCARPDALAGGEAASSGAAAPAAAGAAPAATIVRGQTAPAVMSGGDEGGARWLPAQLAARWIHDTEAEMDLLRSQVEAMRAEMLGLAAMKADPDPRAKELVAELLSQTAANTAEIARVEGSVQHLHDGRQAAESAVGRALKLLHAQVISKPGREELEAALGRAMNSTLDAQGRLRLVNSALDALAAEVRSRASLDRVAELEAALASRTHTASALQGRKGSDGRFPHTPFCLACKQPLPEEFPEFKPHQAGPMPLESHRDGVPAQPLPPQPQRETSPKGQPQVQQPMQPMAGAMRPRPASAGAGRPSTRHARGASPNPNVVLAAGPGHASSVGQGREELAYEATGMAQYRRQLHERAEASWYGTSGGSAYSNGGAQSGQGSPTGSRCAKRHFGKAPENSQRRVVALHMQQLAATGEAKPPSLEAHSAPCSAQPQVRPGSAPFKVSGARSSSDRLTSSATVPTCRSPQHLDLARQVTGGGGAAAPPP